jgi:hypothetical protein
MTHLFPNSAAIISNTMALVSADWGNGAFRLAGPNDYYDDSLGEPIYYGRASDPIYKITSCGSQTQNLTDIHNPVGKYFHMPNLAAPSNTYGSFGYGDEFFVAWDQTTNEVLAVYNYGRGNVALQNCTATTNAAACSTPSTWGACTQSNWATDTAYGTKPTGTGALDVPGWALAVRTKEWMEGQINHALYLNTACEGSATTYFPDMSGPAGVCNLVSNPLPTTNRPFEGNLVFLDYTDAQINAMNLPAWQKPLIMALAHYGGYIGDTNNGSGAINPSRFESNQPYRIAGVTNPLFAWLNSQVGSGVTKPGAPAQATCSSQPGGCYKYQMTLFSGIPNLTGPSCSTACNYEGHMHIADPCVPKGLAGLSGGCP